MYSIVYLFFLDRITTIHNCLHTMSSYNAVRGAQLFQAISSWYPSLKDKDLTLAENRPLLEAVSSQLVKMGFYSADPDMAQLFVEYVHGLIEKGDDAKLYMNTNFWFRKPSSEENCFDAETAAQLDTILPGMESPEATEASAAVLDVCTTMFAAKLGPSRQYLAHDMTMAYLREYYHNKAPTSLVVPMTLEEVRAKLPEWAPFNPFDSAIDIARAMQTAQVADADMARKNLPSLAFHVSEWLKAVPIGQDWNKEMPIITLKDRKARVPVKCIEELRVRMQDWMTEFFPELEGWDLHSNKCYIAGLCVASVALDLPEYAPVAVMIITGPSKEAVRETWRQVENHLLRTSKGPIVITRRGSTGDNCYHSCSGNKLIINTFVVSAAYEEVEVARRLMSYGKSWGTLFNGKELYANTTGLFTLTFAARFIGVGLDRFHSSKKLWHVYLSKHYGLVVPFLDVDAMITGAQLAKLKVVGASLGATKWIVEATEALPVSKAYDTKQFTPRALAILDAEVDPEKRLALLERMCISLKEVDMGLDDAVDTNRKVLMFYKEPKASLYTGYGKFAPRLEIGLSDPLLAGRLSVEFFVPETDPDDALGAYINEQTRRLYPCVSVTPSIDLSRVDCADLVGELSTKDFYGDALLPLLCLAP